MVAGHTAIKPLIRGSGKTTVISLMVSEADKAEPRVFWSDNRYGAKVFMKAMGGVHTTLSLIAA